MLKTEGRVLDAIAFRQAPLPNATNAVRAVYGLGVNDYGQWPTVQLVVETPGDVGWGGIRVRPIDWDGAAEGAVSTANRVETSLQPGRYRVSLVRSGALGDGLDWSVHLEETGVDVDLTPGRTALVLAQPELYELTVTWAVASPGLVRLESVRPDRYHATASAAPGGATRFPGLPEGRYVLRSPGLEELEVRVPGEAVSFPAAPGGGD